MSASASYALLLGIGMLCLLLRNADPVLFPILYAEDARWTGHIITQGFWDAALHARQGFPVLGLVALQRIGLVFNHIVWGRNIEFLPYVYALISYAFMAGCAVLPFALLKEQLQFSARLSIYGVVLLMPMGRENNEVIGRILNLGYLFPVVVAIVMVWALQRPNLLRRQIVCVLVAFISCLTMPVSFVIGALYIVLYVWRSDLLSLYRRSTGSTANGIVKHLGGPGAMFVALSVAYCLLPADYMSFKGGVPYAAKPEAMVEFLFARLLIYPIVAPYYTSLTDGAVCIIFFVVSGIAAYATVRIRSAQAPLFLPVGLAMSALLYAAATAASRVGLSHFLGSYADSFPDRYYYGVNILSVIAMISLLARLSDVAGMRWVNWGVASILVLVVWGAKDRIFEFSHPAVAWHTGGDLIESIAREACPDTSVSRSDDAPDRFYIPAQPTFAHEQRPSWRTAPTWRLEVTPEIFQATTEAVKPNCP